MQRLLFLLLILAILNQPIHAMGTKNSMQTQSSSEHTLHSCADACCTLTKTCCYIGAAYALLTCSAHASPVNGASTDLFTAKDLRYNPLSQANQSCPAYTQPPQYYTLFPLKHHRQKYPSKNNRPLNTASSTALKLRTVTESPSISQTKAARLDIALHSYAAASFESEPHFPAISNRHIKPKYSVYNPEKEEPQPQQDVKLAFQMSNNQVAYLTLNDFREQYPESFPDLVLWLYENHHLDQEVDQYCKEKKLSESFCSEHAVRKQDYQEHDKTE